MEWCWGYNGTSNYYIACSNKYNISLHNLSSSGKFSKGQISKYWLSLYDLDTVFLLNVVHRIILIFLIRLSKSLLFYIHLSHWRISTGICTKIIYLQFISLDSILRFHLHANFLITSCLDRTTTLLFCSESQDYCLIWYVFVYCHCHCYIKHRIENVKSIR